MGKNVKVVAISDIHGQLPQVPECDILLIAGDFVNSLKNSFAENYQWLDNELRDWLEVVPASHIVSVAGNHDFIFEQNKQPDLNWHYLQDEGIEIEGVKIWGSPWQPVFGGWAFNADDHTQKEYFSQIADDTQILVTHSPPYGIADVIPGYDHSLEHVGSKALMSKVMELPKLEAMVCGHIHNAYGRYRLARDNYSDVNVYNAALVNQHYNLVNKPFVFSV